MKRFFAITIRKNNGNATVSGTSNIVKDSEVNSNAERMALDAHKKAFGESSRHSHSLIHFYIGKDEDETV